jgi:hypothetical protein
VVCPLCASRKTRRSCPALGKQICPVCCGTKRLVEIACPSDCPWLASAREHPPAVFVRQRARDMGLLIKSMRDLNERQTQLFLMVASLIKAYTPQDLRAIADTDVIEAAEALAATYETAARGLIYEHRPQSLQAERLAATLKPVLTEAGKGLGSAFDRDAAVVLRCMSAAAREWQSQNPAQPKAFMELLQRVLAQRDDGARDDGTGSADGETGRSAGPSLIVP